MKPKLNAELPDSDNPEWTDADFKRAVRFSDLPRAMQEMLSRESDQSLSSPEHILVPLSPAIVDKFRSTGQGWQARIDAALAEWLHSHSPDDAQP